MKIVTNLETGIQYEFIEYVQHTVADCSFTNYTPHVKVRDFSGGAFHYIPVNIVSISERRTHDD